MTAGPFMNEDGDWWVAVEDAATPEDAAKLIDVEVEFDRIEDDIRMSDHEWGDMACQGENCTLPQPCTRTGRAYHFREVEYPTL